MTKPKTKRQQARESLLRRMADERLFTMEHNRHRKCIIVRAAFRKGYYFERPRESQRIQIAG